MLMLVLVLVLVLQGWCSHHHPNEGTLLLLQVFLCC